MNAYKLGGLGYDIKEVCFSSKRWDYRKLLDLSMTKMS